MASIADQFAVFTFQLVVGLCVVIKGPQHPCIGVVAFPALAAEALFVHIVRLMAGHALDLCLLKLSTQMTGFAGGNTVYADEGKSG